ncbi:MAG: hypothetical protein IKT68_04355 [Clostridia bacterium]|nr:hypothetical protein [Clostridia bacterium]
MNLNCKTKRIPKDLRSCYATDTTTYNLWVWSNRIVFWGKILFWVLLVIGLFDTINQIRTISEIEELPSEALLALIVSYGGAVPSLFEVIITNMFLWFVYAVLEYYASRILALLVDSLASIVHNTRITADVALYQQAQAEGYSEPIPVAQPTAESVTPSASAPQASPRPHTIIDPTTNTWRCAHCDESNPRSALYCKNCGKYR